jgi:hypothetical protein
MIVARLPSPHMADPASFAVDENWRGGHYELAFELGLHHHEDADSRLLAALAVVWREPQLDGCYRQHTIEPEDQPQLAPVPLDIAEPGHLYGRATIPTGPTVVCGTFVSRQAGRDDGVDWLGLYLPMGALAEADPRVGGYPFERYDAGRPSSRTWREPIDDWFATIALRVHAVVPFRVALIGFEASAPGAPWDGHVPTRRGISYVVPTTRPATIYPTTDWDPT